MTLAVRAAPRENEATNSVARIDLESPLDGGLERGAEVGGHQQLQASGEDARPKAAVVAARRCREAGGCGGAAMSRQLQRHPRPAPSRPQRPRCLFRRLWRERSTFIPLVVDFGVCGPA